MPHGWASAIGLAKPDRSWSDPWLACGRDFRLRKHANYSWRYSATGGVSSHWTSMADDSAIDQHVAVVSAERSPPSLLKGVHYPDSDGRFLPENRLKPMPS